MIADTYLADKLLKISLLGLGATSATRVPQLLINEWNYSSEPWSWGPPLSILRYFSTDSYDSRHLVSPEKTMMGRRENLTADSQVHFFSFIRSTLLTIRKVLIKL